MEAGLGSETRRHRPGVVSMYRGEAYKAVEGTQVKDLYVATGFDIVFKFLHARFPDEEDEDELGSKMDDASDLTIKRDEVMPA